MTIAAKILKVTKQLYPTGRAYKMPKNGDLEKFHTAIGVSQAQAYSDALSIRDSILPDNSNFSAEDASAWEVRLGMIDGTGIALADRKLAIARKMNHPGNVPARQHYLYLEWQLQAAGFDVYVHENRFSVYPDSYETHNPITEYGAPATQRQHGQFQHGQVTQGVYYANMVVNFIDETQDSLFMLGDNMRSTFFVGGQTVGTFANVDTLRKNEFRQLILRTKPVQTVGLLLINYI